jgi:predicted transcriptional regulator
MQIIQGLKIYKEENNLSFRELGIQLGVSKKVCFDMLSGKRKFIGLETLQKAQALLRKEA